jgi:hypothetical protein
MSKHTPGPWVADLETYPVMVRSASETWPLVDELGNEEGRAGIFVANTGDNEANAEGTWWRYTRYKDRVKQ